MISWVDTARNVREDVGWAYNGLLRKSEVIASYAFVYNSIIIAFAVKASSVSEQDKAAASNSLCRSVSKLPNDFLLFTKRSKNFIVTVERVKVYRIWLV